MTRNVAIVIEGLGGGGAQQVASALANGWAGQGHRVTVVTLQGREADAVRLDAGVDRVVIGGAGDSRGVSAAILANLRRVVRLRRALRRIGADVVVSFVGATNVLTVLAARGLGQRVIISERNDPARQSLGRAWDLLRRRLYRRADLVTANSRDALRSLAAYVPADRLAWLPNPLRPLPPAPAERREEPLLLAVGRLHRQKGHDVLLEAFARFRAARPEWRLEILGEGAERTALEAQRRRLGLEEAVSLPGHCDPAEAYWRAAVFVHPSRYEGLPNAVLEAMSQGLPVIVTDSQPGLEGCVADGESGLVVPTDSPVALAAALERLAGDGDLRRRLGAAAKAAVAPFQPGRALAAWTRTLGLD